MNRTYLFIILNVFSNLCSYSQKISTSPSLWRAVIHRQDSNNIVFNFEEQHDRKKTILHIVNGTERLRVDSVRLTHDSVFINMPVFESTFKAKIISGGKWSGVWIKGTASSEQVMPFTAEKINTRFLLTNGPPKINITGRWSVRFASDALPGANSVAELTQRGHKLEGTFLTPTGDYRFLEGVVTGNKLKLSCFDGAHAYLFTGDITHKDSLQNGKYFSGLKDSEEWCAYKNPNAQVNMNESAMYLKPGEEKLHFRFQDINGNYVSISDERFKNKVLVVQVMGSWCPNCMDETSFLSDYYNKNRHKGIEIIALAYEYSSDFVRSQKSLKKFQRRFNVQYPILITGVTMSDTLRTEKTLPEVSSIKMFPSSIIIDKKGKVRKLDTGFFGPGTGPHYESYKKQFYATIDKLLEEK